jgi:hypothetical protein
MLWRIVFSTLAEQVDHISCYCDTLQQVSLQQPQCPHTPVILTVASAPTTVLKLQQAVLPRALDV